MLPKWVNTEVKNKWCVSCGCDCLQMQSKEPTTIDMEIVNVWINISHDYLLNIELSLIVICIPIFPTLSKEIRKTMIFRKMTWKLLKKFETQTFSIWIYQFQKRGITGEPLCQTSHNKWHAHLIFISIMYSNFHVDALKPWYKY